MNVDICEFVEKICGIKLMAYQKEMLKLFADLPEGSTIVMGRTGLMILDKNGKRIERSQEMNESKITCEECFHYKACSDIDVTGFVRSPYITDDTCPNFITASKVKIQDEAYWVKDIHIYNDTIYVSCHCSNCGSKLHGLLRFGRKSWDEYHNKHYEDVLESGLKPFCEDCGAKMNGIKEK